MSDLFITGADTEAGKTWAALGIMAKAQSRGLVVNGMKPVASGCESAGDGMKNRDALQIQVQSSRACEYETVNPYAFTEPIAPHIAAKNQGVPVRPGVIKNAFYALKEGADLVVVEGVGGWRTPMGQGLQTEDVVRLLDLRIILVIGLRLGCINHALLTHESILASGVPLAGWLASSVFSAYRETQATIDFLSGQIHAPFLGRIPHLNGLDPVSIARALEIDQVISPP